MKWMLSAITVSLVLFSCQPSAQQETEQPVGSAIGITEAKKKTTIQWLDSTKNLGKISEGEKVEVAYRFVNTGNEPLVIENVVPTCGCTVAEKPEAPVAPGKEGVVKAVFDSHGRAGTQHKSITVYANTEVMVYPLTFDVDVIAKNSN